MNADLISQRVRYLAENAGVGGADPTGCLDAILLSFALLESAVIAWLNYAG